MAKTRLEPWKIRLVLKNIHVLTRGEVYFPIPLILGLAVGLDLISCWVECISSLDAFELDHRLEFANGILAEMMQADLKCALVIGLVLLHFCHYHEKNMPQLNPLIQRGRKTCWADPASTNNMKPSPAEPSLDQQSHLSWPTDRWVRQSDYCFKLLNLVQFVTQQELTDKEPKESKSENLHY